MSRLSEALAGLVSRAPLPQIAAAAAEHDAAVLCVGGAVRDALLQRPSADIDIAVAGDLDAFVALFARHCGRSPVAIEDAWRDTRRTRVGDVQVDIGRMLGDEEEDLTARDFTINAMAVRLDRPVAEGQAPALIDPHDGRADLQARTIRMLSAQALADDPLRMLRALRYLAALEGFEIDVGTVGAIAAGADAIAGVAAERVQAEWLQLLAAPRWLEAGRLAFELGLGEPSLGFVPCRAAAAAWAAYEAAGAAELDAEELAGMRLAALLAGLPDLDAEHAGAALVARRWPRRMAQQATRTAAWAVSLDDASDPVSWVLEDAHCAARAALLARALAAPGDSVALARSDALARHAARAAEEPWVSGGDLRAWGLDEGPALGALLREATRGQIERRWDSAAAARAWARRRVTAPGVGG